MMVHVSMLVEANTRARDAPSLMTVNVNAAREPAVTKKRTKKAKRNNKGTVNSTKMFQFSLKCLGRTNFSDLFLYGF
jgi:hypothetical protein